MNSKNLRGLCEAYSEIYDDGFDGWVSSLIEEGYDLSDYTWDEVYEAYLNEGPAAGPQRGSKNSQGKFYTGPKYGYQSWDTASAKRLLPSEVLGSERPAASRPATTPPAAAPPKPAAGGARPAPITPKPAPTTPPKPPTPAIGKLGNTPFERRTPTSTELKAAQTARASGANPEQALKAAKSAEQTKKDFTRTDIRMPNYMKNSFSWGSASKLVDDIADAYSSIYEAKKKVDQDQDGDNDFADILIARMIASGVPKEVAIAKVRGKAYNEEVEIDEATRMRKELGKEGEIATRKELATRSKAYQRSGSVDNTIAAAERAADRTTVRNRGESEGDYKIRMQKRSQTLSRLAANRRGSVRSGEGLRGYAAKVTGDNRDLQSARGSARSAGTLTPREKTMLNQEFELWVNELLYEGYDLSDYTWDEMYDAYLNEASVNYTTGRTKSGLSPVEKTALKLIQHRLSNSPNDQIRADQQELVDRNMTDAIKKTPKRRLINVGPIASKRFKNAAMRKRGVKVPSVPIRTVPGLKDANTKTGINADFELWVNELLYEGYDLSDYTWDEMYEAYLNEGVLGRDVSSRSLRPASERTGSALTSSQRASRARKAKKEQENQEKLEAQADNIIAQLTGSGRRPSRTSTSRAPAPEASTPSAVVRKLKPGQKKDTTAAKAAEVIRDLQSRELQVHKKGAEVLKQIQQNADFNLWIGELLDEGYELENWTVEDLYDLYEEILEEKYGTAAGRSRVAKMAHAGKDIGKKGPGFEEMVRKLTPKYGKERATKIAAAQMYKTHA